MAKIETGIKTTLHHLYFLGVALQDHINSGIVFFDCVATNHLITETLKRVKARIMHILTKHEQQGSTASKLIKFKISTAESEIIVEFVGGETIFQMMNQNLSTEYRNEQNFNTQNQIAQ